tara:strand:+ start:1992 stop:2822 length:831 start_codon:yes stop_codon:yes gene_type:complete
MNNRIPNQFEGFLNAPSIFNSSEFSGLSLFNFSNKESFNYTTKNLDKLFSKNLVLGKRAEHFFLEAINHSTKYQLIANNIQINDANRTLGELDFIVKENETSKIFHVELMYKFYVYNPEISGELERWIGPNKKDFLLQKIHKVKTNQFPLLHAPETKKYLKSINLDSDILEQKICFKASLFIPKKLESFNFPNINKECIIGFWIHMEDFLEYNLEGSRFFTPDKQDWPINPKNGEEWYNFNEVYKQIQNLHSRKKSPLVWIKNTNGSFERIIVVWW